MDLFLTKTELYSKVDNIRQILNINIERYPIDILFESYFIPNLDIKHHQFKSKNFGGMLMHGQKIDTMILNSKRTTREKEFDCAHEIIHLYEHRGNGTIFNCTDKKYVRKLNKIDTTLEWQANEGAAELLLPWKIFIPDLVREYSISVGTIDKSPYINSIFANKYGVTDSIIEYRVENLRYEILQYLKGVNLDNVDILSNNQIKKYKIDTKGYIDVLNNLA